MSGKRDNNWRSYVGPADNGRTITPADWRPPENPLAWDDLVKCSNLEDFIIDGLTIPAGREDSIDCVRGKRYIIRNCIIHGSLTLKGGIDGYRIENCLISGTIELGQYDNYWTPGRLPTRNGVVYRVRSPDGTPVRLKLWDAERPIVIESRVNLTARPRWVWLPYFFFRHLTNRQRAR